MNQLNTMTCQCGRETIQVCEDCGRCNECCGCGRSLSGETSLWPEDAVDLGDFGESASSDRDVVVVGLRWSLKDADDDMGEDDPRFIEDTVASIQQTLEAAMPDFRGIPTTPLESALVFAAELVRRYGALQAEFAKAKAGHALTCVQLEDARATKAKLAKQYTDALLDITDGTKSESPADYAEAARYWKSRHDLFVSIAKQALGDTTE